MIHKCRIPRVDQNNGGSLDVFGPDELGKANRERNIGVSIEEDLAFFSQAQATVAKCNRILGFVRRSVADRDSRTILSLYATLVRLPLEYCILFGDLQIRRN